MSDWKNIAKKEFKSEFEEFQRLISGKGDNIANVNRGAQIVDYTDIEGDVKRRDLTINALFYDMDREEIVDLVGGIEDLKNKKIRTVGKASERFDEDPLRKLRALRFQTKLGGKMDTDLLIALKQDPSLKGVSSERIRDEFLKSIKSSKYPSKYMETLDKIGFTKLILPGLKVSKPYINDNDEIIFLSYLLRNNDPSTLGKSLNKLNYTSDESKNIVFLNSLQKFNPENIYTYKKSQERTSLSNNQILKFGKLIGKDMKKFLNFKLSVKGNQVPSDMKGPEIGKWIQNKEKENFLNEMAKSDLNNIEKFADSKLSPEDIEFTRHFFDRVNDSRNKKEISVAELTGFFKRLSRYKKQFAEFLKKYDQIVVKDNRTNINIPFVKQVNKVIAKTVMRKPDFKTSNPVLTFEGITFNPDIVNKKDTWYRLGPNSITKVSDNIIDLIKTAYKNTSLGSFVNKKSDLSRSIYWKAIDVDADADADSVVFGRKTKFGIKLQGIGHDGAPKAKKIVVQQMGNILKKKGYWVEANEALEHLFYKMNIPYITSEKVAQFIFPNSELKMTGNKGQYTRKLQNGKIIKETIFGNPITSIKEDSLEKIYDDINEMLDTMDASVITEGGAWGHMNHPFDTEINLTFGQLKDIVKKALNGDLELTREKTDGQALAVTWRNGKLLAARNKGHLKNKGENALDIKSVADKFKGRGELEKAYNFAMNDLSKAIKSLSQKQREKIFQNGGSFVNLEVIYPTSVNVIPYGQALLVLHDTMQYNDDGVAVGMNQEGGRILAGMIKQVNQHVQNAYSIQGPPVIELPKSQDLSSKQSKYNSQITQLQKEFGLKDSDGVAEYHQAWWENWVNKNSPTKLNKSTLQGLVKRWAFFDKSFRLDNKNIKDEKTLEWAKSHEKDNHKKISKDNLMKFENIFLGLGAEVLQFTSSVLTVNPDKAIRDMKKRLDQTIKDVKSKGDEKQITKLKLELERLNSIGGPDRIVPNEGIVFQYKGNTFKLTGAFASLNQLLGIFY